MRSEGNATAIQIDNRNWLSDRCISGLKNIRAEKEVEWRRKVEQRQNTRAWWSYLVPFVNKYPWAAWKDAERYLMNNSDCHVISEYRITFMRTRAEDRLEWILEMTQEHVAGVIYLSLEDYEIVKRHCF